jgi:hypothetical protein
MKKTLSVGVVLLAVLSFAGEGRYIGVLASSGPSVTNWANDAGGMVTDAGFPLGAGMKLSLQCNSIVDILTNSPLVQNDGGPYQGVTVDPSVFPIFPTSIDPGNGAGYIAMIPTVYDAGVFKCKVWQRSGQE